MNSPFLDYEHYFKNGIVHRDISIGNLVIVHREDDGQTEGRLIDLDHAKYTDTQVEIKHYPTEDSGQELAMIASSYHVDINVARRAMEAVGLILTRYYIEDALAFSTIKDPSTVEDLQWAVDVRFHYYQYIPQSSVLIFYYSLQVE